MGDATTQEEDKVVPSVTESTIKVTESTTTVAESTTKVTESTTAKSTSTTQWTWTPENNGDYDSGDYNPGQWEWRPPTTTTTETSFIETSHIKEPLSGDYKVVCYYTNWAWYRPGIGKYRPEDIDPTICTHVVYGFAVLGHDGLIKPHDSWADLDNEFY